MTWIGLSERDIASAILDSYSARSGHELFDRSADALEDTQRLMNLDSVILSHDGGAEPTFVYANKAAAGLWRMPIDELVGMPSRLSAPPEHRAERATMLSDAAQSGILFGYRGERIASDGTRFIIDDATLWTVDGYPTGPGQAVVFSRWTFVETTAP